MRLYEITLLPRSALGTPLAGDTLFGQFCWQAAYDPGLLPGGLEANLTRYPEAPFAVFSSAWPRFTQNGRVTYAVRRPDLPLDWLSPPPAGDRYQRLLHRKEVKKKPWLLVPEDLRLDPSRLTDDRTLADLLLAQAPPEIQRLCRRAGVWQPLISWEQPHNTINRQTLTTGKEPFAPYTQEAHFYSPAAELALFVLLNEAATDIERLSLGLARIGLTGFGKDASIGLGRFDITGHRELPLPSASGANACYTLAPCVPAPHSFTEAFFTPLVRYGKHGDRLATSQNPFKAPVVMAAPGAVFVPTDPQALSRPYFGRAVTGVSLVQPRAVVQGYAPVLPLPLEVPHA
jgi:CRISPR-associated protein Csm4